MLRRNMDLSRGNINGGCLYFVEYSNFIRKKSDATTKRYNLCHNSSHGELWLVKRWWWIYVKTLLYQQQLTIWWVVTLKLLFYSKSFSSFVVGSRWNGVFWLNIVEFGVFLHYGHCSNLIRELRRESEFRQHHCRNSNKSMREKEKK